MIDSSASIQKVIIIGAGRSGTNILRDVLVNLDGFVTWPCDEINYIWRHGNRTYLTDELGLPQATPNVEKYIRKQFERITSSQCTDNRLNNDCVLVEKTCANSLRVDFVDKVIPEAKYIFLIRDGRDVVSSAKKRWKAPLDLGYLLVKARYVPISDLPFYALKYASNRLKKIISKNRTLSVWGPKFDGMTETAKFQSLEYICALQWVRCVENAEKSFAKMSNDKVFKLYYEEFVNNPVKGLQEIIEFLDLPHNKTQLEIACNSVRRDSVGKGHGEISTDSHDVINIMRPTLEKHGYL